MHSPSHLTNFLSCGYLSTLERAAQEKLLTRPFLNDPILELLKKQGDEHEKEYLGLLKTRYPEVIELARGNRAESVRKTVAAMEAGVKVIYQAALDNGEWWGYADFLIRVNTPSKLGNYSYIIEDTKLSPEVKGEGILQLCVYAELLSLIQGRLPDEIAIIGGTGERFAYNPVDFSAYLHYAKNRYVTSSNISLDTALLEMPEPVERCHICNWRQHCEKRWREKDHLKLVAGSTRLLRKELYEGNTDTLTKLAELAEPPQLKRSSPESSSKIHKQAQIQLKGRKSGKPEYEFILPILERQGLAGLPEPSKGDVWFDIEGDVHIGDQGLEYLFGWIAMEQKDTRFHYEWTMNSEQERGAMEKFIRFVLGQRRQFPDMHVYHFGHYEESVLKRLSTRYNLLVDEVDDLLRNEVFVNLLKVVKNGLRLSVEGYGLKEIEWHYAFQRKTELSAAGRARKAITLLLDSKSPLDPALMQTVQDYNEEDCLSTYLLHKWLERLRVELIENGTAVPRFTSKPPIPPNNADLEELARLSVSLYEMIPKDLEHLTTQQKAIKSLADLLLWYRREDKSHWWDFYRMKNLMSDELMDERKGLGGPFTYSGEVGADKKSKIFRWSFMPQMFDGNDDELHLCGAEGSFKAHEIDAERGILDIKLGDKKAKSLIPSMETALGLFASKHIRTKEQINRFKALAEWVSANGIEGDGEFLAARHLLLKAQLLPHQNGSLRLNGETVLESAIRLSENLEPGLILPIQGPPGTGKTFTAAHMICNLLKAKKKVGITAQSHAVIANIMQKVFEENAAEYHLKIEAIKQFKEDEDIGVLHNLVQLMDSAEIEQQTQFHLIGATTWVWAREGMADKVDVLFIDEAGQFALADAIAASHSAASLVLLGDPQQLENVTQGVHPPEIEVSVLGYWLDGHKVIRGDQGLFLENTYRMAPAVNDFISQAFYEGKLKTIRGLENQKVISNSRLNGSGLRFIPCAHEANDSSSKEEVALIKQLIEAVLTDGSWIKKDGTHLKLTTKDILIVAPYNAQVNALRTVLPEFKIGTVDKFQGKQAPLVIYSMASSSPEEAPRGMEFLYSLNRLNVAVSRAQCLAVLVASPALFELSCKTPHQMKLANAFCRFLDMAE